MNSEPDFDPQDGIAVIGMAGRFPGAGNVDEYWRNLRDGVESIRFFSDDELIAAGVDPELIAHPAYVRAYGCLDGVDLFDPRFFGFSPSEAAVLDPQDRLFLECAWEALENAGYAPDRVPGSVGVFGGEMTNGYMLFNIATNPEVVRSFGWLQIRILNDKDFLATRVSYKLNLKGPSISVQTACSTSLVAVHLACESLLGHQSDMALAGGVSLQIPQRSGYLYQEGSVNSPDGHCRAFDAQARGTVGGSGVGIVVLKRLEDALADGDRVRAVIRGTAVNNDGSLKVGYTAPSVDAQAAVISTALGVAGAEPRTVTYVEAHGTGTLLGDPVEVAALARAFRQGTAETGFCAIGSVKTNIGHLDHASGVASLIKTVLALEHRQIPPSLHYRQANPEIDFARSPFYVNARLCDWPNGHSPRRAGISSLGVGGTNAHAILEEAPEAEAPGPSRPWQLLALSARTAPALERAAANLAAHFEREDTSFADAAYTLAAGRSRFDHRRIAVCADAADAVRTLRGAEAGRVFSAKKGEAEPAVVFLFPGQGTQHVGMARELYASEATFRQELDRCAELLRRPLGEDLRSLLYPGPGSAAAMAGRIEQTAVTQPLLFAVEYALARQWMEWGVTPRAMLGHSLGEIVAACLAGVLELADALSLVTARGRLIQSRPGGAMLAVELPEQEILPWVGGELALAAVNAPGLAVVSGPPAAIADLEARLRLQGVESRRLRVSHAFHSASMDAILPAFREEVSRLRLSAPRIPFLSNVTGTWITAEQATDPGYWARHVRRTVRFSKGVEVLSADPGSLFLEVGPGSALGALVKRHGRDSSRVLSSLPGPQEERSDLAALLTALGRLWLAGVEIDVRGLYAHERRRRVPLPSYPFERVRCWVEAGGKGICLPAGEPAAEGDELSSHVPPRNEVERALCEIWQGVLGVERVGIHDNFLELGGHSLLATRVTARIRELLEVDLPTSALSVTPTVAGLASTVAEERHTGGSCALRAALPAIVPDPGARHEPFPLTDVQQAYWVGRTGAFELGGVATHVYFELDSDELDSARLEQAWQRLVDRHDLLRTVFLPDGRQRILERVPPYRIAVEDLSGRAPAEREAALEETRRTLSHQVLPAGRWPLFELRVSRLEEGRSRLHLSVDLLIADAWSFSLLGRDLGWFYKHPDRGLPALELSFRDYVLAEATLRETAVYRSALDFWRGRLEAMPPGPELPLAKSPSALREQRFVRRRTEIDAATWQRLKRRAARAGLSQPGVVLAAFARVLAAWSKSPLFTLNLTLFNRLPLHPEVNEIVGDFTSLTLLEVDFSAPATFEARAQELQRRLWLNLDHRYVSGVRVLRDMARSRGRTGAAIAAMMPVVFTSTLNFGTPDSEEGRAFGLPARVVYGITQTPQIWLDHHAAEGRGGTLVLVWDAVEELFPPGLLDTLFETYQQLLRRLADDESAWAQDPGLMPARDLELVRAFNATEAPVPAGLLHEPFLEQARLHPERTAVITPSRSLTYGEVAGLSARLAHRLRGLGVVPNTLVAVAMEKGWEEVVAVLAILQAGAAYLPIDPAVPAERFRQLLEQGEVQLALSQSRVNGKLEWPAGIVRIEVDAPGPEGASEPLPPVQTAGDVAYVIFTSGSTGRPKGVMIDHRGALNTIVDVDRRFAVGPEDRVLALSALSFDLSVYDVFGTLAAGGAIVQPDPEALREPARWLALMEQHGVTVWNSVPALLQMLVEHLEGVSRRLPPSLRLCLLSGDWIPVTLPERVRALAGGVQIVSLGGATEASIWSILYPVGEVDPGWKSIPYGRPMASQRFHVLDRALEPRPVWVTGELYIGGAGVALGYWRDEERTRAGFVDHPVTGERLYRTGDLGRLLPGGIIEFLGREDTQVKIQGYRIELGEIEAALRQHPGIAEGVVVAAGGERAGRRLVAYAVPSGEAEITPDGLRGFLAARLPRYMVPAAFVLLDALPLSANGKLDRRALPEPGEAQRQETVFELPRNPVEEAVAGSWQEVLARERVGVFDDFFELGGDSLLATRAVVYLQSVFPVEVPLRALFEHPTVAGLAGVVEELLLAKIAEMPEDEAAAEVAV